jgi:hypothetical protein
MEGVDHVEPYTAILRGAGLSHERTKFAGAEALITVESSQCRAPMRGPIALTVEALQRS